MSDITTPTDQEPRFNETRKRRMPPAIRKFGTFALIVGAGASLGALVGWRDARADQGRLDAATNMANGYEQQIAITEAMIARNEENVSPDCLVAAMPFIAGDETDVDLLEATDELRGREVCPEDTMELLYKDRRDYTDLSYNQNALEQIDLPGLASDAAKNDEVWQRSLVGAGLGALLFVFANS